MGSPWHRTIAGVLLFLGCATGATLCHLSATYAWQIVGSFLALVALALLGRLLVRTYPFLRGQIERRQGAPLDLAHQARRLLPPLFVVGTAVAVLAPLLAGQMPLSHDHPVHLYKAWHFWDEMLLAGRLRGWSSYWFFGYPAEELYPIGPDLWVALFRAGTLGLFSWEATYGLAFVGVFAFAAYAVYSFGRRFFSAGAGVIAGLLWVLDRGEYREGGWSYTVDWAVWVQILAMGFALLALGRLQDVLERGKGRDWALCGLLVGAALLSHPMNVMVLGLSVPLMLLARAVTLPVRVGREIAVAGAVVGLGVAIAGFWFLPMTARSAWTASIGDLWRPFNQTAKGVLDGTLFANVWPGAVMLGLVGAGVGLAMRRWVPLFLTLLAAILLFASSSTAFHELNLMAVSQSFSKIQWQRLVIPAKACLFLLAGFALAELAARVAAWRRERDATPATETPAAAAGPAEPASTPAPSATDTPRAALLRRAACVVLVALLLAPFGRPIVEHLHQSYLRTIGGLVLKKSIYYWDDYQQFLRWSAQKRAESKTFYRISYELDRHNHLMMGAPVFNRTPYYKVGYTPARLFKHVTETTEDPLYRALSVAYIVSLGPISRPNLKLEVVFGSIHVYRFTDYRPERYTLSGPGRVEVIAFDEERIHLKLSGTGRGSRLKVHVAGYPRWRARMNGETVPISDAPAYGAMYPMLMEVPVTDGELVFDYVTRGVDAVGALLTLLGLGVVALLLVGERRPSLRAALERRTAWVGRLAARCAGWAALGLALLLVGGICWRLVRGGSGLGDSSLANLLSTARVVQAGKVCGERRRDAWFCSERSWNYVGPTTNMFNGAFLPCIWAHPVDEGPLTISFPRLTLGHALVGNHGLADGAVEGFPGGSPVSMEIQIDGQHVQTIERPNEKGWVGFRVDTSARAGRTVELSLTISTAQAGGRHYCFDLKLER